MGWARYARASARRYDSVPVSMMLRRRPHLDTIGHAHYLLGHQEQATTDYQQSPALKRELGTAIA